MAQSCQPSDRRDPEESESSELSSSTSNISGWVRWFPRPPTLKHSYEIIKDCKLRGVRGLHQEMVLFFPPRILWRETASYFLLAETKGNLRPRPCSRDLPWDVGSWVTSCEHRPYAWDTSLQMLTCMCPHCSLSRFFLMGNIPGKLTHLIKGWGHIFLLSSATASAHRGDCLQPLRGGQ